MVLKPDANLMESGFCVAEHREGHLQITVRTYRSRCLRQDATSLVAEVDSVLIVVLAADPALH